jgi:hypothetical protein
MDEQETCARGEANHCQQVQQGPQHIKLHLCYHVLSGVWVIRHLKGLYLWLQATHGACITRTESGTCRAAACVLLRRVSMTLSSVDQAGHLALCRQVSQHWGVLGWR